MGLLGLAMLMTGLTAAELIKITHGTDQDALITKEALDQIRSGKGTAQRYLAQYQKAADKLARRNMFVPPPDGFEPPGDCTAIFGDEARIGERWVKAGDTIGNTKVLEVGPTAVTLLWEGKKITRSPILVAADSNGSRSRQGFTEATKKEEYNKKGEVAKAIKPDVTWTEIVRDGRGLVTQKVVGYGDDNYDVIDFKYDYKGNLNEQIYTDGTRVLFDTAGKMTEKITPDGTVYNLEKMNLNTQGSQGVRKK